MSSLPIVRATKPNLFRNVRHLLNNGTAKEEGDKLTHRHICPSQLPVLSHVLQSESYVQCPSTEYDLQHTQNQDQPSQKLEICAQSFPLPEIERTAFPLFPLFTMYLGIFDRSIEVVCAFPLLRVLGVVA